MDDFNKEGVVYFLKEEGEDGNIKIGHTKGNPLARANHLQTGNSRALELLAIVPGSTKEETEFHHLYDKHHIHGDWFHPIDEIFCVIDRINKGETSMTNLTLTAVKCMLARQAKAFFNSQERK